MANRQSNATSSELTTQIINNDTNSSVQLASSVATVNGVNIAVSSSASTGVVANPFGGMALPLSLLAQHQQQQLQTMPPPGGSVSVGSSTNQQTTPPIYLCPPGVQQFPPYFFPGTPMPFAPGASSVSPAHAAAMLAAMGVSAQSNPSSPWPAASQLPVFRFMSPQGSNPNVQQVSPSQQQQQQQQPQQQPPQQHNVKVNTEIGKTLSPHLSQQPSPNKQSNPAFNKSPGVISSSSVPQSANVAIAVPTNPKDLVEQQQQQQQQQQQNLRQRKRPPNIEIPYSNLHQHQNVEDSRRWSTNETSTPVIKTPKTAPTMPSSGGIHWSRGRGRPPLHFKVGINSADPLTNGSMFSPHHGISSTSTTYNSPNRPTHSAGYSTGSGSDPLSAHQQQQEIIINSPVRYPEHFKRGSLIRLADGSMKCVEEMTIADFKRSAHKSGELQLDSSQVLQIDPIPNRGAAMLYLAVGEHSPINVSFVI